MELRLLVGEQVKVGKTILTEHLWILKSLRKQGGHSVLATANHFCITVP